MARLKHTLLSIAILPIGLVACTKDGPPVTPEQDSGLVTLDSGGGDPDAGGGLSCEAPPPSPYGVHMGTKLQPFTLPRCDETEYDFYNEEFCASTLTVVSIAAGWCPPCRAESEMMTEFITEPYRDRGVRVIQILVQDESYRNITPTYCQNWVDNYGLTNIELYDNIGFTAPFFPDGVLPSTLIIDNTGTIMFRENGATDGLISLRAKLDELLAGM